MAVLCLSSWCHNSVFPKPPSCTVPLFFLSYSIPSTASFNTFSTTNHLLFPLFPLNRSFLSLSSSPCLRSALCRASIPPPNADPSSEKQSIRTRGLAETLSKVQDRVRIFFAVLFWMSLFFWTSAWDGRNRPNKGSRFRK